MTYNKIIFGYDVMTYNGEIPNCLHPKFLNTIHNASDFDFRFCGEGYRKRWNNDWHLYNSNFWNSYVEKKSVYDLVNNHQSKNWFYPVEPFGNLDMFFGNHHFYNEFALKNISSVALESIKSGNGNLLINYIIDGGLGMTKPNFQKIIDFTRSHAIPDNKVYLIFQDFRLKRNLEKMGAEYNVINFNLAQLSKSQEFNNTINNPNFSYWGEGSHEPQVGKIQNLKSSIASFEDFKNSIGSDKKDFLLLNRHWKLHRLLLMSKLHKLGLDNNLVSWDNKFYHQNVVDAFLEHDNNIEFTQLIKDTSRHLDVTDLTKIAGYGFEDKNLYINSYLSLVSESIYFQIREEGDAYVEFPTGYLSEKIWKPIGHCQPFILAGPAHSLEYIRSIGYKTFHPFIDESYDNETNDFTRLNMILNEVEKFSNKSKEDKDQFLRDVTEICKYNQKLFLDYSKQKFRLECDDIITELNSKSIKKFI